MRLLCATTLCAILLVAGVFVMPGYASDSETVDTLRMYQANDGIQVYPSHSVPIVAARFSVSTHAEIHSVMIWVKSTDSTIGSVWILGHEAGSSAPYNLKYPLATATFRVDTVGIHRVVVQFEDPVAIEEGQFFVVVRQDPSLHVLSDMAETSPECKCPTDRFRSQCLLDTNGLWTTGAFTFLIEPVISSTPNESAFAFAADTILYPQYANAIDRREESTALVAADIDGDGWVDLAGSKTLLLGPVRRATDTQIVPSAATAFSASEPRHAIIGVVPLEPGRSLLLAVYPTMDDDVTVSMPAHDRKRVDIGVPEAWGNAAFSASARLVDGQPYSTIIGVSNHRHDGRPAAQGTDAPDRIIVLKYDGTGRRVDDVFVLHPEVSLHSGMAMDLDEDHDLDMVVAVTFGEATPGYVLLENSHGKLVLQEELRIGDASLILPPTLALSGVTTSASPGDGLDVGVVRARPDLLIVNASTDRASTSREMDSPVFSVTDDMLLAVPPQDRASTVHCMDLNADGHEELIVASADRCRPTKLYERSTGDKEYHRVFGTGIENLSGCPSLAFADLDKDGDVDIIGSNDSAFIVVWNDTRPTLPLHVEHDIDVPTVRQAAIVEVQTKDVTRVWTASSGRGLNTHDPPALTYSAVEGSDKTATAVFGQDRTVLNIVNGADLEVTDASADCKVMLSPNPSSGVVHIRLSCTGTQLIEVDIRNTAGDVIWRASQLPPCSVITWAGESLDGTPVASGHYTLVARAPLCTATVSISRLQ